MNTPDWNYWKNLAAVPLREAVALSCNVDHASVKSFRMGLNVYSPPENSSVEKRERRQRERKEERKLVGEYENRLNIAGSHVEAGTLQTEKNNNVSGVLGDRLVQLSVFREWGESLSLPFSFPDEFPLAAQTKDAGQLPTEGIATSQVEPNDKPLDPRERASLLCIIGALAKEAKLNLVEPYKAGGAVAAMLDRMCVKMSARRIGDHLKAVREAMNNRVT